MTGPEHYKEAEDLVAMAAEQAFAAISGDPTEGPCDEPADLIARAQVHATLAHTAATVDLFALYGQTDEVSKDEWRKAVSPACGNC